MITILLSFFLGVFPAVGTETLYEPEGEHLMGFDVSYDMQHWWAIGYDPQNGYRIIHDAEPKDWWEDQIDQYDVVLSDSGGHIAYVVTYGGREMAVLDDVPGDQYDQVGGEFEQLDFSPDGRHLAYTAYNGEQWVVVHDGKASPGFDHVQLPTFSRDSKHWVFAGRRGERWSLMVDGKVKAEHDYIEAYGFLPDGSLQYVSVDDGRWTLIRSGRKKGSSYDEISQAAVSSDGQHCAYAARTGEKWRAVCDGKEGALYDNVQHLTLSPSGRRCAYAAGTGNWVYDSYWRYNRFDGSFVAVLDGRELLGGIDGHDVEHFMFSPDETHVYYTIGKIGENTIVAVDTTAAPPVYGLHRLVRAKAADRIAYGIYERDSRDFVVFGGQRLGPYEDFGDLGLTADGEHLAATVKQGGKWRVMIDGKLQEHGFDRMSWLRWAPDQRSVAVIGLRDKALCRAVYAVE